MLTPKQLIDRAAKLRPMLRDQQEEAEKQGFYSQEVHEQMVRDGLYRILQPRRFGGYEFDIPTFFRVVIEIARGDPGSGWCFSLGTGHALPVGSHWSERAQAEVFGPDGDFRAPHRAAPGGSARRVEGGYVLTGRWRYSSGVPYATYFMGTVMLRQETGGSGHPEEIVALVPRGQYTMLRDWGGGNDLGLQASGSNTVLLEDVFVPDHLAISGSWRDQELPADGTPGTKLHGNPMYLGRVAGFYHGELVSVMVGAARAALDEYESVMWGGKGRIPPYLPKYQVSDEQQYFGLATAMSDAAEAILIRAGESYMEYCRAWADEGRPFTVEDDTRLHAMLQHAGHLAVNATEIVFAHNSPDAAKKANRLNRYIRDVLMYRMHHSSKFDVLAQMVGESHFGQPLRSLVS